MRSLETNQSGVGALVTSANERTAMLATTIDEDKQRLIEVNESVKGILLNVTDVKETLAKILKENKRRDERLEAIEKGMHSWDNDSLDGGEHDFDSAHEKVTRWEHFKTATNIANNQVPGIDIVFHGSGDTDYSKYVISQFQKKGSSLSYVVMADLFNEASKGARVHVMEVLGDGMREIFINNWTMIHDKIWIQIQNWIADKINFVFNPDHHVLLDHWKNLNDAVRTSLKQIQNLRTVSLHEDNSQMNTWDILTLVELESEPDDGNGTSCQIAAYLDVNDDGAIHINVRKSINGKVNQTSDRMWKPIIDDTWADLQK